MELGKRFCTFYLDGLLFGLEVEQVQEVIRYQRMTSVPLAERVVGGLINLRGQIVLAVDLRIRLALTPRVQDHLPMNVVIRTEEGPTSLLVDEIGDVVEVDESMFEPAPESLKGVDRELIRGVYKLDESLLVVLQTNKVVDLSGGDA